MRWRQTWFIGLAELDEKCRSEQTDHNYTDCQSNLNPLALEIIRRRADPSHRVMIYAGRTRRYISTLFPPEIRGLRSQPEPGRLIAARS